MRRASEHYATIGVAAMSANHCRIETLREVSVEARGKDSQGTLDRIHFRSDGLALSPTEYARLLARLAENEGIAADEFSRDGVVRGSKSEWR